MFHPKFWRSDQATADTGRPVSFDGHMKLLLDQCGADGYEPDEVILEREPLLNADLAKAQADVFCLWVRASANELSKATMAEMWTALTTRSYFRQNCSEWIKLARIAVAMVAVSVEDERVFSVKRFVGSDSRSRSLDRHLEACVRMMVQEVFDLDNFPYAWGLEVHDGIVNATNVRDHEGTNCKEGPIVVE